MNRVQRQALPVIAAVVAGVAVIVGVKVLASGDKPAEETSTRTAAVREGCVGLTVASSSEKAGLMAQLAAAYNQRDRLPAGQCVDVTVVSSGSGDVEKALVHGWDATLAGANVPRPDVWSPAGSLWLQLLRHDQTQADVPSVLGTGKPGSVTATPLVIAMPKDRATALGWPRTPIGWADITRLATDPRGWGAVGHPEWGRFTLGKTNPTVSTSGMAAIVGQLAAAAGTSSDLRAADLAKPAVLRQFAAVEAAVVHYGDTTLTFSANLLDADKRGKGASYVSAIAMEEKSVADYNEGNPSGDPQTLSGASPPTVPLVAVFPKEGTLFSDNPFAVLDAAWVTPQKKAGATDFLAFLREKDQQEIFVRAGFRGADLKPNGALVAAGVATASDGPVLTVPSPAVLAQCRVVWQSQRKPARALLLMDVSGSMDEAAATDGNGSSRMELAKQAATTALGELTDRDEIGLWTFTTSTASHAAVQEVVPVAAMKTNQTALRLAIEGLEPGGGTPLYQATEQAFDHMATLADDGHITGVILLTDGKNEFAPYSDINALIDGHDGASGIHDRSIETGVRVFTVAYSSGSDYQPLQQISEATRARAYDATAGTNIVSVLTQLISNF